MAAGSLRTSRPVSSLLLGLVGTLAVIAAHIGKLDRRAELHALDVRFRNFSHATVAGDIVHVDIDDGSLDELGRWPWPRQLLAGIIDVLDECGAQAVVLDIILPEPQKVRYVSAAGQVYGGGDAPVIAEAPPVPVFDDAILAESIRRGRGVALPMHIDFAERQVSPLQVQVREMLVSEPLLSADEIAARLRRPCPAIESVLRRSRQSAIGLRVGQMLSAEPEANFAAVLASILPGLPRHKASDAKDMVEKAYLRHRAIRALERFGLPAEQVAGYPLRSGSMVPPLVMLARVAHLSGFVTVKPDEDGVVRRIPLLGRSGQQVYMQFALAVAARELGRRHSRPVVVSADAASVSIRCADGAGRVIPLDSDGFMLIHWLGGAASNAEKSARLRHIPAMSVAAIWQEKKQIDRLSDLTHGLGVKFLGMGYPESERQEKQLQALGRLTDQLDDAYMERLAAERLLQRVMLYEPSVAPDVRSLARLRQNEQDIQAQACQTAKALIDELRSPANLKAFAGDQEAQARQTLKLLDSLPLEIRNKKANLKKLLAELRTIVAGKICMIGSTATGAADFVPTPMGKRTPGVTVHSNIINTILSGSFIRQWPLAADILVILAAGLLVALLAATRPVLQAALLAVLLAAGYVAFNCLVVFDRWGVWLVAVAPVAAMLVSFLLVTAYRQLTEERAKRHIKDMFAHAMSPALVDRLLEDPSLAELGGQKRTLTCMFSDIAGFTPLSESLGPPQTVRLLNRYFDRVTEVVQNSHGGYLNKFLGDGIFCFFGAPVFQEDHPLRAVRAAVDCQAEVAKLNDALQAELGPDTQLSVRIGVTTGEAMVGNCGSTQRMDYTAIGDCVNLASRLEAANKFFGTHILVDDRACRLCKKENNDLFARPLGAVFVTGQREAVKIWNVLGAEAAPEQREVLDDFAGAVELFTERKFKAAARLFQEVHKVMPDDRPAKIYLDLARECAARPTVGTDWDPQSETGGGVVQIAGPWRFRSPGK
ncbi:MAG: CHASE2 domain-containing protein [Planctomycetota bacterium]|nr:CHASE2 domain-containing protein [Planctomycetota bacterium]